MNYDIQVDVNKYKSNNYLTTNRWSTYYLIVDEIIKLSPKSVLEIGPGNFMVSDILKKMNINVATLDFDAELNPDYVCDIADYKNFPNKTFDCIIASQVFEHIKYEDYLPSLKNLKKHADFLILTLPFTSKHSVFFYVSMYLPAIKRVSLSFKIIWRRKTHQFNGQHYWEIGKKTYPLSRIKKDIKRTGWKIMNAYINPKNPYHYIFILK